jgi:hypothetical protein
MGNRTQRIVGSKKFSLLISLIHPKTLLSLDLTRPLQPNVDTNETMSDKSNSVLLTKQSRSVRMILIDDAMGFSSKLLHNWQYGLLKVQFRHIGGVYVNSYTNKR